MGVSVKATSLSSSMVFFEESTLVMFHTVEMSYLLTVIWLHLYAAVNAKYCDPPTGSVYASIRFCQSGTVSSLNVYINGSSILTKESLIGKECVCHVVWSGNSNLGVNGFDSCNMCGLDVTLNDSVLSSGSTPGWGITSFDDKAFRISMKMNQNLLLEHISPEFCLLLRGNGGIDINVTLTCEDPHLPTAESTTRSYENATSTNTPTTASSELPIFLTKEPSGTESTTPQNSSLPSGNSTAITVLPSSELPIYLTKDPPGTETLSTTPQNSSQPTRNSTTITVLPGLTTAKSASNINEVIIPAAAGGGTGMLIILVIITVACCRRKKKKHVENPISMSEVDMSDAIMTDNPTYGKSVDAHTNAIPRSVDQCTGVVYAVVNKEGNSNVLPPSEVRHMHVGDTGDVYAIVSKETRQDIPDREHSRGKSSQWHAQTISDQNNDTLCTAPSTDYVDITINTNGQSDL